MSDLDLDKPTETVDDSAPDEDVLSREFVDKLVDRICQFRDFFTARPLHPYQQPLSRRIIESVVINDGAEITALASRQSGKTETVAGTLATLMVLLPRLALIYPDLLGQYKDGLKVGMFAPVEGQVETLYQRTTGFLTSNHAKAILSDPEIDDTTARVPGVTKTMKLVKCGSFISMMTANPKAKIESKTFQVIVIDECQEADDFVVNKSIMPMGAYHNATKIKTGTPTTSKNNFYKSIQLNKRLQTQRGRKQNHYQWDWKDVAKYNKNYETFVRQEMLRIGDDSDEFQMSFAVKWILERGMFVTESIMDDLGDTSMEVVKQYLRTPVVVGIDPARKVDSTVVTVVWVDWDRPDEFGYYDHRVLNWLELQGDDYEDQYFQIVHFLSNYDVLAIGVDGNGVGDAVAERLKYLMPRAQVIALPSSPTEQSKRWKHLQALIQRRMVGWPAHAKTRRLKVWQRFRQQMIDAEKEFKGPNFVVHAPDEAHAHDDYVDSLAIACAMTADLTLPTVEVGANPFYR